MKTFGNCWIAAAKTLFSQALAGEPQLTERELAGGEPPPPHPCTRAACRCRRAAQLSADLGAGPS